MIEQELVAWYLEEIEDIDSNRQDGFTFVLRKDSMPAHHERAGGWVSRRALRSMLRCPEQIGFLRSKALIEDHDLLEVLAGTLIWQDSLIRDCERLIKSHEWQIAELARQLDDVRAWAHSMEAKLGALQTKLLHVPALSALRGRVERWRPWPKINPLPKRNPQIGQSVDPEQLTCTMLPYETGRPVAGRMEESDFDQLVAERAGSSDSRRWGSRMVEITGVELLDRNNQACDCFHSAEPVTVRMQYVAHEPVRDAAFGIAMHYQNGVQVLGLNTVFSEVAIPSITGAGVISCAFSSLSLLAGSYYLTIAVYDTSLIHAYDHQHFATSFTILGDHSAEQYGFVTLPHRWLLQIGPEKAESSTG
jgi:Wzt C-terminal domain